MAKITKRSVDALMNKPAGTVIRDEELTGFQARKGKETITFAYEYRAGSGRTAPVRRLTLGRYGSLTPDEARTAAKAHAVDVAGGGDPAARKTKSKTVPTFRDFATAHLKAMAEIAAKHPERATLRTGSIRNYRSLLKVHVGPAIGSRRLDMIGREDIAGLHRKIGREKPATANRALEFVGSIYRAAADAGHVPEGMNPARNVKAFKESKRERFLSPDELARLAEAIRVAETTGVPYEPPAQRPGKAVKHAPKALPPYVIDAHAAAALRLLIFTGARLREILTARWADFDADRGLLRTFGKTGPRHVFFPAPAVEIVVSLPRVGEFIIASGDPAKPKADLNRPWRAVRKLADLEGVRLHDLRHSFASVAVSGGASLHMVGKLLGHTQSQTTMRYAHLSADPVRAAAEAAAGTIAAAMQGDGAEIVQLKRGA